MQGLDRISMPALSPSGRLLGAVVLLWTLTTLYQRWKQYRLERALKAARGAHDAPRLQYRWPLALDILIELFRSDRNGTILHWFEELRERHGRMTLEQLILGARSLNTVDPVNIEAILNSQFSEFGMGTRSHNFGALLGYGIFTQDGPDWKASRELLRPQFMHTRSEYFSLIQAEAEKMIESLLQTPTKDGLDMQPWFFRLTLNTTTDVLFGRTSDTSTYINNATDSFANAFNDAQHTLARRARVGDLYWFIGGPKFRKDCGTVHRYIDEIVQAALAANDSNKGSNQYIFLKALMDRTRNSRILRDQLINVLLAGRDTTACCLTWTLRLLAEHPGVQSRLREECRGIPSYAAGSLPTKDELKQMDYLEVVIREVLRLYPSVPANVREARKTTTIPRGGGPDGTSPVLIRKHEAVNYNVYCMHRLQEIYGPDATAFRPERWLKGEPNSVDIASVGWGYLPFNGGPRACLGQEFGLLEAKYATVRLLQAFKQIEFVEPLSERKGLEKHVLTLVLTSADGCKVRMIPT